MRLAIPPATSQEQSNFRHLVMDIIWFGLAFPALGRFLSVYAIHLGADADDLSLMTSLPALLLLGAASMSSWWLSRFSSTQRALLWPSLGFRLQFLLPALTPFMPADFQMIWLILCLTLTAIPQGLASVAFLVLLREAVSDQQMPPLLSRRSLALNVTVGLSGLGLGVWLERAPFPFSYQAMYVVAFALVLVSFWHVMQLRLLPVPKIKSETSGNPWRSPAFRRVGVVNGLMHLSFFSISALIPLHLVRNLGASESFMSVFALCELIAGALVALVASRIVYYTGNRTLVGLSIIGTAISALIIALSPHLHVTLLAAALNGASWTLAGIGLFSYFSSSTPIEHRATYTTAYTQIIFVAQFFGPMLGSSLSRGGVELVSILLIGAALRLAAGVLIQTHLPAWFKRTFNLASLPR
ncbi:MAG: MFS transporter [Chloroflexi bacterium]|nr:MFS transporter [Chloroflexota bacterium]